MRPKATTFRLDPPLQEGLVLLQAVLKKPLNRLVNEAVRGFIQRRTAEVESDLQRVLTRVKAYRRSESLEAARRWQSGTMAGLEAPRPEYAGRCRGERGIGTERVGVADFEAVRR